MNGFHNVFLLPNNLPVVLSYFTFHFYTLVAKTLSCVTSLSAYKDDDPPLTATHPHSHASCKVSIQLKSKPHQQAAKKTLLPE